MLTKQPRYFFDQEAVRERYVEGVDPRGFRHDNYVHDEHHPTRGRGPDGRRVTTVVGQDGSEQHRNGERWPNPTGRNIRSVWTIATQPYPEAHFATYPEELVRRCVLAGCPERVCLVCNRPWERVTETECDDRDFGRDQPLQASSARHADGSRNTSGTGHRTINGTTPSYRPPQTTTLGWEPTCDCADTSADGQEAVPVRGLPGAASDGRGDSSGDVRDVQAGLGAAAALARPGVVLDPFVGSGTTCKVARDHGRHSVGVDLNPAYLELAAKRLSQQSLFSESAVPPTSGSA